MEHQNDEVDKQRHEEKIKKLAEIYEGVMSSLDIDPMFNDMDLALAEKYAKDKVAKEIKRKTGNI